MPKFRKKPVVVEAEEWPLEPCFGMVEPYMDHAPAPKANGRCDKCGYLFKDHGWVKTLEGGLVVCPHDRIIKGEHYACKPDIFEATYDAVADEFIVSADQVKASYEAVEKSGQILGFEARRVICPACQPLKN